MNIRKIQNLKIKNQNDNVKFKINDAKRFKILHFDICILI